MKSQDIDTEIRNLRAYVNYAQEIGQSASAKAMESRQKLEAAVCKRAGVSEEYLQILLEVVKNPLTSTSQYPRFRENAIKLHVISQISGGRGSHVMDATGNKSRVWYEPGKLGKQILAHLKGEHYEYKNPFVPAKMEEQP